MITFAIARSMVPRWHFSRLVSDDSVRCQNG